MELQDQILEDILLAVEEQEHGTLVMELLEELVEQVVVEMVLLDHQQELMQQQILVVVEEEVPNLKVVQLERQVFL